MILYFFVFAIVTLVLALLSRGHPAVEPYLVATVLLSVVTSAKLCLSLVPPSRLPKTMSATATWRVAVTVTVFVFGLPVVFVTLARSSWSVGAVLPLFSRTLPGERWLGLLEALFMYAVPVLVAVVPGYLQARGRAAASSLVPGWLAGFASVLTAAFILMLHFGGIAEVDLRKAHMGILSVAAFGVAVLLAPFYRVVVEKCLQQGIAVVFDPARWWSSWCDAYREMRRAPAVTVEAGVDGARAAAGGEPGTGGTGGNSEVGRSGSAGDTTSSVALAVSLSVGSQQWHKRGRSNQRLL